MTTNVTPSDIGIIVLAAGAARRFGADKRQVLLDSGQTLLESTLASVPAVLTRRILVVKPGDEKLADAFAGEWQVCIAKNSRSGMANSLASGINLAQDWAGALIALADMPCINPITLSALQSAMATHDIVIPTYRGKRGNPVGFRHDYFDEIGRLRGDRGAKSLLDKYASACAEIETGDSGILRDIDTPEGLRELGRLDEKP
jgi:molybdenum cofactor cytidylyltransferase